MVYYAARCSVSIRLWPFRLRAFGLTNVLKESQAALA